MQIILKRAVHFIERKDNIVTDAQGVKHNLSKIVNEIKIFPSEKVQYAPDWIENDPMFDALVEDGLLVQVAVLSGKSSKSSDDDSKSTPAATDDTTKPAVVAFGTVTPNVGSFGLSTTK